MDTGIAAETQVRELAVRALALLAEGDALVKTSVLGPRPDPELEAVLSEFGRDPPLVAVRCADYERCSDARRICTWVYDTDWGSVLPKHRQTRAWTQGAPFWLDRANATRGAVQTARGPAGTHDGTGTHNYMCPSCHVQKAVSAERRLRLYLTALAEGEREVRI
jgi:hypothetical protein